MDAGDDPVLDGKMHQPHGQRIARQKDKLHDAVDDPIGEVPVLRDAQIVIRVGGRPEFPEFGRREIVVYIMHYHPGRREIEQPVEQAEHKDQRKRQRPALSRALRRRVEPEREPARHEAHAGGGEQDGAAERRSDLRRAAGPVVPEPDNEKQRQQGEPRGADGCLQFSPALFAHAALRSDTTGNQAVIR